MKSHPKESRATEKLDAMVSKARRKIIKPFAMLWVHNSISNADSHAKETRFVTPQPTICLPTLRLLKYLFSAKHVFTRIKHSRCSHDQWHCISSKLPGLPRSSSAQKMWRESNHRVLALRSTRQGRSLFGDAKGDLGPWGDYPGSQMTPWDHGWKEQARRHVAFLATFFSPLASS